LERRGVETRAALGEPQYFDGHDLLVGIEVEDDAGRDFLGFQDLGFVQVE
jgi:hypothetical protein